jgi:hypothetical protein
VLFEVFEKLTSACLSKFYEKPCYYLLIIYINMFETIVVLTYIRSEHSTGKIFLALLGTAHYLLYRGGLRRNWGGGPLNFLIPARGALKKYRETKEGGL